MSKQLGFEKGRIIECVVTTYNKDRSPNAAPMGVYTASNNDFILNIHLGSDTHSNIIRNKGCVINLVYDPFIFLRTTIRGHGLGCSEPEVESYEVSNSKNVFAPILKEANAYIEVSLNSKNEYVKSDSYNDSKFSVMRFSTVNEVIIRKYPTGYNRGLGAAVELAIKLSRGQYENIQEHMNIMKRTMKKDEFEKINLLLQPYFRD